MELELPQVQDLGWPRMSANQAAILGKDWSNTVENGYCPTAIEATAPPPLGATTKLHSETGLPESQWTKGNHWDCAVRRLDDAEPKL